MKLLDDVLARVKPVNRSRSWCDRLPPKIADEVLAIRERYRSGELGDQNLTRLSVAIVESLIERGHEMPKPKQVSLWLAEKR